MTLADFFNAPTEVEFEGKKLKLRQPNQLEQGMFQRWLEQRAYDGIERRTYQDPSQQSEDRKLLNRDIAAGLYEWGGEVSVAAMQTPIGVAKLLSIICADDGLDHDAAMRLVDLKLREIAAALWERGQIDPKELTAILKQLGLPKNYFSKNSLTRRSASPRKNSRKRRICS